MTCGVSWRRRVRDTGGKPRDPPDCNQLHRTLGRTLQSSSSHSPYSQSVQVTASSTPIISRPYSTHRRYRFFCLGFFITRLSSPFLSVVSSNRKRAADILINVGGIEGAREGMQLSETMKNGGSRRSSKKKYSVSPADYRLLEEVGNGASATVYRALHIPNNEIVAVKCLDLDRCNSNLDDIRREAQTMSLAYHPNVIKGYCSFVVEQNLWFVMPFMAEGSCFHLMKVAYPDGFEEHVIGSILKETLKALEYLHKHGHIHRDVKAGNILLDRSGAVKLSDFGSTACMFDKGDRQHSRNTFVGTPCWMAPEVMQPGGGYDFKADIWSFGITALELAHGHAPFSKYPPMKVLLMTLQNAPPGLDYDRDKKFSKSFKEMVAMCLVKDQTKRPTAEKLLKHSFLKNAKPPEFSVKTLLADLPPLWERVKSLQLKDAEQLALKKMPSSEQEALSQTEYRRGVSAWNFDIEDLKVQASSIVDDGNIDETVEDGKTLRNSINIKIQLDENISETKEGGGSLRSFINNKEPYSSRSALEKPLAAYENSDRSRTRSIQEGGRGGWSTPLLGGNQILVQAGSTSPVQGFKEFSCARDEDKNQIPTEKYMLDGRKVPNLSAPLMLPNHASANNLFVATQLSRGYGDYLEDMSKENVVQIKGRFSVKSVSIDIVKPVNQLPKENGNISLPAAIPVPHIQNISQQASLQQENHLVSEIPLHRFKPMNDVLVKAKITERELLLLVKISELQSRISSLTEELTAARLKHAQLQQELNTANGN